MPVDTEAVTSYSFFMVMRIVAMGLALLFCSAWAVAETPVRIPEELQLFVEIGSDPIALESADLNGDGRNDFILVLERKPKSASDGPLEEGQRPFLIILRLANGKLKLEKRNSKIVLCSTCGGVMGDPFSGITVGRRTFSVNHYGGSSWRWTTSFKFNYSRKDETWQLVEAREISFHASDPEKSEEKVYRPPKDYGKVDISNLDPEHYLK